MEQMQGAFGKKYLCLVVLLFVGLGWGLYANTLDVPFYLDDFGNVQENISIRASEISLSGLWRAGSESLIATRPLANISFALNYYLHQYQVGGYHLVNIGCHILTGIFLFLLFRVILQSPALGGRYSRHAPVLALAAAVLWFVNPVHTQTVTYIVQRMNGMAAMFYVLSLWLYLRGRLVVEGRWAWPWLAAAAVAGLMAIGSKEIAVTLPFMMWLADWYFIGDLDRAWLRRCLPYLLALCVIAVLLTVFFLGSSPWEVILGGYAHRDYTLAERLFTELRVVVYYLGLLLYPVPSRLNLDYDFVLSHSFWAPSATVYSGLVIFLLLVLAVVWAKRARLFSFAVFWFLGNLLLESSLIPLEIIFEHRTYLPSMFVSLCVVAAGYRLFRPTRIAVTVLAVIVGLLSFWTVSRNEIWRDPVRFWADCAEKSPGKSRPHNNLSVALRESGDWERAFAEAKVALRLNPQNVQGRVNMGNLYSDKGMWRLAEAEYRQVLQVMPSYAEMYVSIGNIYVAQGRVGVAADSFQKALALAPNSVRARTNLGMIFANQGREREAIVEFERARALSPGNSDIHFNLGLAYEGQGRYRASCQSFSEALRLNPADKQAAAKLVEVRRRLAVGL